MGSFFAGVKAGTLGGIVYVGGLAVFNALLLIGLKHEVLGYPSFYQMCSPGAQGNVTALNQCFSVVLEIYVPFIAFIGYFIALFFTAFFGLWYERIPGRGPVGKGEIMAGVIGIALVYSGFYGFSFNFDSEAATGAFLVAWTIFFGYVIGVLYKRYTRSVAFQTPDPSLLKILVDGKDFTGKTRTFATTSSHKVRAELADDASFKEWEVSGGVNLEDARSFDTIMEVNGDGLLKGKVGKKY